MYVCMYVCMYTSTSIHTHKYAHNRIGDTCRYAYVRYLVIYVSIYVCIAAYMHAYDDVSAHCLCCLVNLDSSSSCMYIHTYINIISHHVMSYVHMYIYIYIYTHTYLHKCIYTHAYILDSRPTLHICVWPVQTPCLSLFAGMFTSLESAINHNFVCLPFCVCLHTYWCTSHLVGFVAARA
jgi:hypothetical protein